MASEGIRRAKGGLACGCSVCAGKRYADGGSVGDYTPAMIGAGALAASRFMPRPINRMARPLMRAMSRPYISSEAASSAALTRPQAAGRYDLARRATAMPQFSDRPSSMLQGAWEGDHGMEFNDLFTQPMPRRMGPISGDRAGLEYAAQLGTNLDQSAVPYNRFVPHLINSPADAGALEASNVDAQRLKDLAELVGSGWATSHRPGNRAFMFPLDESLSPGVMGRKISERFPDSKIRYGVSESRRDRMLLTKDHPSWGDGSYGEFGAVPRSPQYEMIESDVLREPWRARDLPDPHVTRLNRGAK